VVIAQPGVGQQLVPEFAGGERGLFIRRVAAMIQYRSPDRAIKQAGVEVWQLVSGGECAGDGALATGGGAVDGDNHGRSCLCVQAPTTRRVSFGRSLNRPWAEPAISWNVAPLTCL